MAKKKKGVRKRKYKTRKKRNKYIYLFLLSAICFAAAIFLVVKYFKTETETFVSEKYFIKGIDVSHHNPIINWSSLIDENITFAYIKATEGVTHIDQHYEYNYELAQKTDIHIGSYHFFSFTSPGSEQAKHFINTAKFESGNLIPAIDVEHSPSNPFSTDKKYVELVIKELKTLENELYEYFGIHPVIYTNKDCYKHYIEGRFPDNLVWFCDLQNEPPDKIENWRIWQFSHRGEFSGIGGHVDLNYYRYSFEEFKELLLP